MYWTNYVIYIKIRSPSSSHICWETCSIRFGAILVREWFSVIGCVATSPHELDLVLLDSMSALLLSINYETLISVFSSFNLTGVAGCSDGFDFLLVVLLSMRVTLMCMGDLGLGWTYVYERMLELLSSWPLLLLFYVLSLDSTNFLIASSKNCSKHLKNSSSWGPFHFISLSRLSLAFLCLKILLLLEKRWCLLLFIYLKVSILELKEGLFVPLYQKPLLIFELMLDIDSKDYCDEFFLSLPLPYVGYSSSAAPAGLLEGWYITLSTNISSSSLCFWISICDKEVVRITSFCFCDSFGRVHFALRSLVLALTGFLSGFIVCWNFLSLPWNIFAASEKDFLGE